jgi:hypothetical protein
MRILSRFLEYWCDVSPWSYAGFHDHDEFLETDHTIQALWSRQDVYSLLMLKKVVLLQFFVTISVE